MDDTLDALDLDRLRQTLQVLKDGGATYFRYRDLEISIGGEEEAEVKTAGFVPKERQAITQAEEDDANDGSPGGTAYHKAFGGRMPSFTRAKPPQD